MAIMSGPNDWMQHFYQQNFATQPPPPPSGRAQPTANLFSDTHSTVLSNMTTTSPNMTRDSSRLSAEGGVSRPARRRPRASRRTPVTTMNTDAANFRAMVQHFTGGPRANSAPEPGRGGLSFEFGLGAAPSVEVAPSGSFQQHLQQQQQFHQNQVLYGTVNNDPRFGGSYVRSGSNMDGSQPHHGDGSSSSNDRSNNSNNTSNMF